MRIISFALALVVVASLDIARAETAADVQPLSTDEMMRIAAASKVPLDSALRAAIAELVSAVPEEERRRIEPEAPERLLDVGAELTIKEVSLILMLDGATPLVAQLDDHEDPVLRFIANVMLAGRGNSGSAAKVYEVLHSEAPTLEQKRVIATWAAGIGLRPTSDTAESIYEHLSTAMSQEPKIKAGQAAPDFEVHDMNGKPLALKKLRGRAVLLHFWSEECGPCVAEFPLLKEQLAPYPESTLVVIAVSLDEDRQKFEDSVKAHDLPWHNVFDGAGWGGRLARAYGVNYMPYDFVIDANGVLQSYEVEDLPKIIAAAK